MRFPLSRPVALVLSAIGFLISLVPAEGQQFNSPLFPYPDSASTFKVADVTGDGRPDVVSLGTFSFFAGQPANRPLLSVLVGQANGSLTPRPLFQLAGNFAGAFAVGHIDGDTRSDIVYTGGSQIVVLRPQANGTYLASYIYDSGKALVVSDFNGDGKGDVIVASDITCTLSLYTNDGTSADWGSGQTLGDFCEGTLALADLNADGKLDLVVSGVNGIYALLATGYGLTYAPRFSWDPVTAKTALSFADFNGDGHLDAVATAPGTRAELFYGDGRGLLSPSGLIGGADARAAVAGDFNGDGLADIATTHQGGTSLYLGNGQGGFTEPVAVTLAAPVPLEWMSIDAADLNQDGRADLVALGRRTTDAASSITVALGPLPIVDAGPPVTAMANTLGVATVTLNGLVINGPATSVLWSEAGTSLASVASPTVQLAVGVHTLTFSAVVAGVVMTDTVVISVHLPTSAGAIGATGPQGPAGATGANGAKGEKGDAGTTGPQGPQGLQGPQGPAGATGPQGPAGADGAKGDKGDAGATGAKGDTGAAGAIGPAGPQGLAGANGVNGNDGAPGAKGDKGDAGANGADGAKGDKGDTGSDGAIGPAGPQGLAGANGANGNDGAPGAKGDKGDDGATGAKGDKGDKGADGAIGPAGSQGPQGLAGANGTNGTDGAPGAKGDKGDDGATGAKGDKGDKGADGAIGPAGPQGPQGLAGAIGPQGPAGAKGDKGATGANGAKGDKGDAGPVGPKGATGANGINGTNGTNGTNAVAIKDSLLLMPDDVAAPAGYRRIGEFTEEAIDADGRGGQRKFRMTIVIWQKL